MTGLNVGRKNLFAKVVLDAYGSGFSRHTSLSALITFLVFLSDNIMLVQGNVKHVTCEQATGQSTFILTETELIFNLKSIDIQALYMSKRNLYSK